MSPWYRSTVKWARLVHLYATLFGLGLLVLFAVTGFLLNHEDWFVPADPYTRTATGQVPTGLLVEPDRFTLTEWLRREQGATGFVEAFEIEADHLRVVFKRPGREALFEIRRPDGHLDATVQDRGLVSLFLDLHRGKSCGLAWSVVIDVLAGLMLLIAATGLVLWWSLKGRGRFGVATLLLGVAVAVGVYFAFVP